MSVRVGMSDYEAGREVGKEKKKRRGGERDSIHTNNIEAREGGQEEYLSMIPSMDRRPCPAARLSLSF
jgi:hypothetical protein